MESSRQVGPLELLSLAVESSVPTEPHFSSSGAQRRGCALRREEERRGRARGTQQDTLLGHSLSKSNGEAVTSSDLPGEEAPEGQEKVSGKRLPRKSRKQEWGHNNQHNISTLKQQPRSDLAVHRGNPSTGDAETGASQV